MAVLPSIERGIQWVPRTESVSSAPIGVPRLIWEVLNARGIESEEAIQQWLYPSLKSMRDPLALREMDLLVDRLVRARIHQEPLVIYADYDLDGTSGLALLLSGLRAMGFEDVSYYQPKRLTEGYGLHSAAIEMLYRDRGRRILLSVDLGITAVEEVKFASSLGMDVLITDHHLPKEVLPEAIAVVNPNRGNCDSGLGHLCGTGVAFYLILALRRALMENGILATPAFDPKELLDCFAIGTLTDMVPLIDENRVLVRHGLLQLAKTKRPGLRLLLQALGLWGNSLTSQDVAIRFAPKLNALSRMDTGIMPIDLYLVETESEAQKMVDEVLANNAVRQASQKQAESLALDMLTNEPPTNYIFVYSEKFHRGVVGLVATRLCQDYGLPCFVGSLESETGQIVGSVRMPDGTSVNALDAMSPAADVLDHFGGHAMAAGFELSIHRTSVFRERLSEFFSTQDQSEPLSKTWVYDAEASLLEFSSAFMAWYENLGPFGVQFAAPLFKITRVDLTQVRSLKGGHLRLTLRENSNSRGFVALSGLWFSPPKENPLTHLKLVGGEKVDALVEPQWNYFAGKKTLQLLIHDVKLC